MHQPVGISITVSPLEMEVGASERSKDPLAQTHYRGPRVEPLRICPTLEREEQSEACCVLGRAAAWVYVHLSGLLAPGLGSFLSLRLPPWLSHGYQASSGETAS